MIGRRRVLAALGAGFVDGTTFGWRRAAAREVAAEDDRFAFAVVATATNVGDRATTMLLKAVGDANAAFVVHYERSAPSAASCTDAAIDRRRELLDAATRPVVPVVAAGEWADCGGAGADALERLDRVGDAFFAGDASLGRAPMPWLRQSALPRYRRYRENVRWQVGRVLFATLNVPDNNNDYRPGAGRNGEFDERTAANRAWLERTFRVAGERRLAGIVLFVEAAPRFDVPLRAPDTRVRERDGFYELKLALRERVAAFGGQVLLVQSHRGPRATGPLVDRPLRDGGGRPLERFARTASPAEADGLRWLRVTVDPTHPRLFDATVERVFDDPSGELYGPGR